MEEKDFSVLRYKYKCKKCGKNQFFFNLYAKEPLTSLMKHKKLCWECAYWEEFITNPPENLEIIGNQAYQIMPYIKDVEYGQILGGGHKRPRYILRKNWTSARSNDYWWIATIPSRFQHALKPTAWWTNRKTYESIQRSKHKCTAKGCLDRYHCFRYQYQIDFPTGPYNNVPKDWNIGEEHCPAFISTRTIKDFDEYFKPSDLEIG